MKKTFIQLSLVVGIAIVLGGIYNFSTSSADNHLGLTVKDGRYANALVCKRSSGDEGVPIDQQPAGTRPPAPAAVDPVKPPVVIPAETPAEQEKPAPVEEEAKTPRILIDEAFEEWEDGALFIDARRSKVYVKGHIPGAVSISPWENTREERVAQLAEKEDLAAPVVVYCTRSKDCEDSEMISGDLKQLGFTEVKIFQGGYPVWLEQEKAVTEGEDPGERPGQ
tara:strand:- start:461 stop:1129 length:669 start_codon:yes stop_codon:yes gene_type:complete